MTGGVFTGRRNVQAKHPDRQVIASVPTGIAWFSLTMLAAALAFAPYALYDYLIDSEPGLYKRHYTIALVLAAIVAVPFFLRYARHLFSGHRHMIWVEAGEVIFLDREHFAVRCSDIADIKRDFDDRGYAGSVLALKDGGQKRLVIQALNRSHHEIAARLRTVCGFPEDPNAWKPREGWGTPRQA